MSLNSDTQEEIPHLARSLGHLTLNAGVEPLTFHHPHYRLQALHHPRPLVQIQIPKTTAIGTAPRVTCDRYVRYRRERVQ